MGVILGRPIPDGKFISHDHDDRYYDKDQVNTISGSLQSEIDGRALITHDHLSTDTTDFDEAAQDAVGTIIVGAGSISVTYDDLVPSITISGATAASGVVTDHNLLTNLDFESSGHIGFVSTEELTTISGDIVSQIPTDYALEEYVDTISGALNDKIEALEVKAVEEFTLTSTNISNKYVELSNNPSTNEVIAWVDGGTKGLYNDDYVITENDRINWSGKEWDGILEEGDVLTVLYWH